MIIDLPDPLEDGPSRFLYTKEFYELVRAHLEAQGVISVQSEAADITDNVTHVSIIRTLRHCFSHVVPYQAWIPFYGLAWGFAIASKSPEPIQRLMADDVDELLAARQCMGLRHYDGIAHLSMFSLPRFLRRAYEQPGYGSEISDASPIAVPRQSSLSAHS